jgi:alpha-L-fucosidase
MPTGEIDPKQVEALHRMGEWLRKYGETIYSTRGGPIPNGEWGGCTSRGNKVWVHVLQWPGETLRLGPLAATVKSNRVLTGGEAKVVQTPEHLEITLPAAQRDPLDTIIELDLG